MYRPTIGSKGGAFPHGRGTPVGLFCDVTVCVSLIVLIRAFHRGLFNTEVSQTDNFDARISMREFVSAVWPTRVLHYYSTTFDDVLRAMCGRFSSKVDKIIKIDF